MDKLAGKVTNTVANLTVYDIKAGIRKVQNGESCGPLLKTPIL